MERKPGDRLGPYQLVSPIGKGGMGEVWKARDTRLHRDVAIKFCSTRFSDRFLREARAIAALNHPNICTLYDIGPDYLVMEYIEGTSPRGPLTTPEAVRLALGIAVALEVAHGKGIIHRDLKPANVLVTQSGVKLFDFGLALVNDSAEANVNDAATALTTPGMMLGTIAYMAPEQAQGKPADARSDVFAFGLLLYELLSGRRAFQGDSPLATMAAILQSEPPALSASIVTPIVTRCLKKDPAERFQTMAAVREALEQSQSAPAAAAPDSDTPVISVAPSIAVLPFANIGADKENEYFSDGLAEEILNALSQVEGLSVAARTSSFSFKGKGAELSEIGVKLRVANILEGSVRRAGNRVRVTVQLVDARNGFHLWSERYDRQMEDIFEVQDEIARVIAERLKVTLRGGAKRSTNNLEAYELYLKGRHHWHQRAPSTLRVAIQCFEQAIQVDPRYALAWSGLADCYGILRVYGWVPAEEARPHAHAAIAQAMTLDPSLWEVNFSRGVYAFYFERDWRQAGPHFQKAIAINPRSSLAQVYYSLFLASEGRAEDAVKHATLACQTDPLSAFVRAVAGGTFQTLDRFDAAERAARQSLELQPGYLFGLWVLGMALCGLGRNEEAIEPLERALALSRAPMFVGNLGLAYGRAGRIDDATRLLRELEERSSRGEFVAAFASICIYVGLGDLPAIRRSLSKALTEATPPASFSMTCGRLLEAFRSDPEIDRLLFELYGR